MIFEKKYTPKETSVDGKGNRLVVRNGYHKSRIVQTACGNVEVKLSRVDDRKATEKFVSKILPPFARKTPTVETLIAALYLYFYQAAEQNDKEGVFGLGECYAYGWGVEKDFEKAKFYFAKAKSEKYSIERMKESESSEKFWKSSYFTTIIFCDVILIKTEVQASSPFPTTDSSWQTTCAWNEAHFLLKNESRTGE